MLRDIRKGSTNIFHSSSCQCKRVFKSGLVSGLFAMVVAFDKGSAVAHRLVDMFGRTVPLGWYTDSQPLYGLCASLSRTTERRFQIYISLIREAY